MCKCPKVTHVIVLLKHLQEKDGDAKQYEKTLEANKSDF